MREHPDWWSGGKPNTALGIAGQALRDFNHRSHGVMDVDRYGWQYAPDANRALGELSYLVGALPQVLDQIRYALGDQLQRGLIVMERGSKYEGHPEAAAATAALDAAHEVAQTMYGGVAAAQTAINAVAYARPSDGQP
jgi:hypothetical protein